MDEAIDAEVYISPKHQFSQTEVNLNTYPEFWTKSSIQARKLNNESEGNQLEHAKFIPQAISYKLIPRKTFSSTNTEGFNPSNQHKKQVSQAVISTKEKLISKKMEEDITDSSNCIIY